MNFSEKLQLMRRSRGYTQEQLARELNVSRQAVAKWESGYVYPDIMNLVQISNLLHVSIDYLVKEESCSIAPVSAVSDLDALIAFRLRASRNTYAAMANRTKSSRPASVDFRYEEGPWLYHNTYLGGEQFAGQEAIWQDGRAVYAMNYMGRVLADTFSGSFLKEALLAATPEMPFRGPELFQSGEYVYRCRVTGDFTWHQGHEEIHRGSERVYECFFHGGLMK